MAGVHGGCSLSHLVAVPRGPGLSVSSLAFRNSDLIDIDSRYFGVFDGHGGAKVAAYAANHLHRYIVKREEYKENRETGIKEGFLECDRTMRTVESLKDEMAGCTAVTVFIQVSCR